MAQSSVGFAGAPAGFDAADLDAALSAAIAGPVAATPSAKPRPAVHIVQCFITLLSRVPSFSEVQRAGSGGANGRSARGQAGIRVSSAGQFSSQPLSWVASVIETTRMHASGGERWAKVSAINR